MLLLALLGGCASLVERHALICARSGGEKFKVLLVPVASYATLTRGAETEVLRIERRGSTVALHNGDGDVAVLDRGHSTATLAGQNGAFTCAPDPDPPREPPTPGRIH
jgi:hypothetical protein